MPRIERLDLAVVSLPDWHPEAHAGASVPVCGYVVDHPEGAIVVDTASDIAATDSIRRLKALRPQLVHFSHCSEYRPPTAS